MHLRVVCGPRITGGPANYHSQFKFSLTVPTCSKQLIPSWGSKHYFHIAFDSWIVFGQPSTMLQTVCAMVSAFQLLSHSDICIRAFRVMLHSSFQTLAMQLFQPCMQRRNLSISGHSLKHVPPGAFSSCAFQRRRTVSLVALACDALQSSMPLCLSRTPVQRFQYVLEC